MNQMQESPVVWVHSDGLNERTPALASYPDAPALWVWDEDLLRNWLITIYQSRFIYDYLLKMPVTIRRGNVVTELIRFAQEHSTTRIVTTSTSNPGFLQICRQLQAHGFSVEIFEDQPMLAFERPRSFDLKWVSAPLLPSNRPALGK